MWRPSSNFIYPPPPQDISETNLLSPKQIRIEQSTTHPSSLDYLLAHPPPAPTLWHHPIHRLRIRQRPASSEGKGIDLITTCCSSIDTIDNQKSIAAEPSYLVRLRSLIPAVSALSVCYWQSLLLLGGFLYRCAAMLLSAPPQSLNTTPHQLFSYPTIADVTPPLATVLRNSGHALQCTLAPILNVRHGAIVLPTHTSRPNAFRLLPPLWPGTIRSACSCSEQWINFTIGASDCRLIPGHRVTSAAATHPQRETFNARQQMTQDAILLCVHAFMQHTIRIGIISLLLFGRLQTPSTCSALYPAH